MGTTNVSCASEILKMMVLIKYHVKVDHYKVKWLKINFIEFLSIELWYFEIWLCPQIGFIATFVPCAVTLMFSAIQCNFEVSVSVMYAILL